MSVEAQPIKTPANISAELTQEIEGAVNVAAEKAEAERKALEEEVKKQEQQEVAEEPEQEQEQKAATKKEELPEEEPNDKKPPAITDDLIERAVKAGLSLKDAKEFTNSELLARMVERLEETTKPADEKPPAGETKAGDDPAFKIDDIPDLDPEEYDEEVVAGFKTMKALIKQQSEELAALRSGNTSGDAITTQLQKLGKEYADAAPAGSGERAELEKKLRILKAGYKAAGEEVADGDLFAEAAKFVLGDVIGEKKEAQKAEQLAKRRQLHLSRPSGSADKPKGDPLAEIAREVDAAFFKDS